MSKRLACLLLLSLLIPTLAQPEGFEDEEDDPVYPQPKFKQPIPAPIPVKPTQYTYTLEFLVGGVLVLYAVIYFVGKSKNEKIALTWLHNVKAIFDENFSHVGVSEQSEGPFIQKEASHVFKFYGSGRINCAYALATLELKKRQDLLSSTLLQVVFPERDRMILEFPIKASEPIPVVFAILKKTLAKNFRANSEDIKSLTSQWRFEALPSAYVVMAENDESVNLFLSNKNLAFINNSSPGAIESIVISDQRSIHPGFPISLRCEFLLPKDTKDYNEASKLCQFALSLVDQICSLKLSVNSKLAAEKERRVQQEAKQKEAKAQREEELQKKKTDKKKNEDEKAQNLSKEKQRRIEEKEYRQSLKKKGPKVKLLKA